MLRWWISGSIVLHILIIWGSGLWFPGFSAAHEPETDFLEIFTDSAPPVRGDRIITVVSKELLESRFSESTQASQSDPLGFQTVSSVLSPMSSPRVIPEAWEERIKQNFPSGPVTQPSVSATEAQRRPMTQSTPARIDPAGEPAGQAEIPSVNQPGGLMPQSNGNRTAVVSGSELPTEPGDPATDLPVADVPPLPVFYLEPVIPEIARRNNWTGVTVVLAEVKVDGRVGEVTILKSSGYEVLDREAVRVTKKRRYKPALKDGEPVHCQTKIRFRFNLEG